MKKILGIIVMCVGLVLEGCSNSPEETKYQQADQLFANGNYEDAATLFLELGTYSDASLRYTNALIMQAKEAYANHNFEKAISLLNGKETEEALKIISQCYLGLGEQMFYNGEYDKAISYYQKSSEENIRYKIEECNEKIKESDQENKMESKQETEVEKDFFDIEYVVNQSEEEDRGEYYKNGEGTLKFQYGFPEDDWVGLGGRCVTMCHPESTIHFVLVNNGEESLANPTVKFEFSDVILKEVYEPFVPENHVHGVSGYGTAILSTHGNLQPGMKSEHYMLSLSEAHFNNGSSGKVKITLSADNYKARSYTVSLQLIGYSGYDEEGDDYIISYSDSCYLTEDDLKGLSTEELRLARNEIYARHGRKFLSEDLQEYFNGQSWYSPVYEAEDFPESLLNAYEKKNAKFIKKYE